MLHVPTTAFVVPTILEVTTSPVVEADPIFAAIQRHHAGWQAFQDAPDSTDDERTIAAADEEMNAGFALLATTCTTREGLGALLRHLDWYVTEERDNLIAAAEFGAAFLALLANLRLATGLTDEASTTDPVFALIKAHEAARAACDGLDDGVDPDAYADGHDARTEVLDAVCAARPRTVPGLLALIRHHRDVLAQDGELPSTDGGCIAAELSLVAIFDAVDALDSSATSGQAKAA